MARELLYGRCSGHKRWVGGWGRDRGGWARGGRAQIGRGEGLRGSPTGGRGGNRARSGSLRGEGETKGEGRTEEEASGGRERPLTPRSIGGGLSRRRASSC